MEVEQHAAQVAEQHQHSALSGREEYDRMYRRSVEDPNAFWRELAEEYHWEQQASSWPARLTLGQLAAPVGPHESRALYGQAMGQAMNFTEVATCSCYIFGHICIASLLSCS